MPSLVEVFQVFTNVCRIELIFKQEAGQLKRIEMFAEKIVCLTISLEGCRSHIVVSLASERALEMYTSHNSRVVETEDDATAPLELPHRDTGSPKQVNCKRRTVQSLERVYADAHRADGVVAPSPWGAFPVECSRFSAGADVLTAPKTEGCRGQNQGRCSSSPPVIVRLQMRQAYWPVLPHTSREHRAPR